MLKSVSSPFDLLLCRPGAEPELGRELELRHALHSREVPGAGVQLPAGHLPPAPCVFEWQRLPGARFYPLEPGEKPPGELCRAVWEAWARDPMPWAAHLLPSEALGKKGADRLRGVSKDLVRQGNALFPGLVKWERKAPKLVAQNKGLILQWLPTPRGLIFSANPPGKLGSPVEGGRHRMRMDPKAPSRSYLKIEEAFVRMGREPRAEETAIDLGAAPGGWSYALAKRGCRVTAVDNGPLRIDDACVRRIEHLHADGVRFQLSRHLPPVDWLVADMLIPPGKAFGVLRHWIGERRCRHLVFNIKLPRQRPLPALLPLVDWLSDWPELRVRQLYHDRREVTVFGSITS